MMQKALDLSLPMIMKMFLFIILKFKVKGSKHLKKTKELSLLSKKQLKVFKPKVW